MSGLPGCYFFLRSSPSVVLDRTPTVSLRKWTEMLRMIYPSTSFKGHSTCFEDGNP